MIRNLIRVAGGQGIGWDDVLTYIGCVLREFRRWRYLKRWLLVKVGGGIAISFLITDRR